MASTLGIPLSKVSPAFLHANSTSHTWVFSAFAEIIDNAYDPDVSASELLIDQIDIRDTPCLIFLDNGAGMDRDHLLKMLSFGFCEKDIYERQGSHQPIGHYGNGFKSGSMRIGMDALVFTRSQCSASIGFLSQTYLKAIQTDCVVVPILDYRLPKLERIKSQESRNNLNAILQYSVFKHEEELKAELRALEGSKTGTKIIISNLKRLQDGTYELDFSSDPTDIRCPEAHEVDLTSVYHRPVQHSTSEYKTSLREYCSILFLRPRMKITIRGIRVKSKLISKSLSNTEIDMYKPTWLSRPVKIIFGFTCETEKSEDYGMMLYHRNRLIKAYEKVGYQKQPNELGLGVVGVAQVDFLQPIHNKQDFNKDEKFNSVMAAFAMKLNDYWNEKKGQASIPMQQGQRNNPDWLWAQCDQCLKWRRLPDGIDGRNLPDQWYCRLNPDATHNRCDIPEEPEDEDLALKPTYEKTFKKKQEERKRLRQIEMEKEDEIKKRKMMEKERELREKEAALKAIQNVAARPLVFHDNGAMSLLQKELAEAKRREENQRRLIMQIQEKNKEMEQQRNSFLQMAENLKTLKGKKPKEVFEQMNHIIESLTPSLPIINNTKQVQPSPSPTVRKGGRLMNIKTESGEILSITQNDINGEALAHDNNIAKHNKASRPIEQKQKDGLKMLPALVPKPPSKKPDGQSASTPTSRPARQRHKPEKVLAVIDLTSDKEFGDLVDIKPNLDELRTSLQDNLRSDPEDVKPDKDTLNAAIANIADKVDPVKDTCPPAETKKEIVDSAFSEAASDKMLSKKAKKLQTVNSSGAPGDSGLPDDFHDNLEAAFVAIKEKMDKKDSGVSNEAQSEAQNSDKGKKTSLNSDESLEAEKGAQLDVKKENDEQSILKRLELSLHDNSYNDDTEDDINDDYDESTYSITREQLHLKGDDKINKKNHSLGGDQRKQKTNFNENNGEKSAEDLNESEPDNSFPEYNIGGDDTCGSANEESMNNENHLTHEIDVRQEGEKNSLENNASLQKTIQGDKSDCPSGDELTRYLPAVVSETDNFLRQKSHSGDSIVMPESFLNKDKEKSFTSENFLNESIDSLFTHVAFSNCIPPVSESKLCTTRKDQMCSDGKAVSKITEAFKHCCKCQVEIDCKETQTASVSVAEMQTDTSDDGSPEPDLKEQLEQTQKSLEEAQSKMNKFYSDVHRLLKFSFTQIVLGDEEDIEKIVQNLLDIKQEQAEPP